MTMCPYCKKQFLPLGIMRHRQACGEQRAAGVVINGRKRPKRGVCSRCGHKLPTYKMKKINKWHQGQWICEQCGESEIDEIIHEYRKKKNVS